MCACGKEEEEEEELMLPEIAVRRSRERRRGENIISSVLPLISSTDAT